MLDRLALFAYKYFLFFLPNGHPWDYIAHFIVNFAGVLVVFAILKIFAVSPKIALLIASLALLAVGIVKEINDFHLGKTDIANDMAANLLGITMAVMLIILIKLYN